MTSLTEPMDLGISDPIEVPVKIDGSDYVLREASGAALVKYHNAQFRSAKITDKGGVESLDGLADAEPVLVGECLFPCNGSGKPESRPVGEAEVRRWPGRIQTALFARVKAISGIGLPTEKAPDPNSSGSSTVGSDAGPPSDKTPSS